MIKLPNTLKTVAIDAMGEVTRQRWAGTFTVKAILSNSDRFEVDRITAQLTPKGSNADRLIESQTIAQLAVRVVDGPAWWEATRGGKLMADMEPLYTLLMECSRVEQEWKEEVAKLSEGDKDDAVDTGSDQS